MCFLTRIFLLTILFAAAPLTDVYGQESLPDEAQPAAEPAQPERIVEGRPPLYSAKRWAHPLTWLEGAVKPIGRSAESGWIHRLVTRRPSPDKTAGIRFGAGGVGNGSGYGPRVTLFHKDFLGRKINVQIPLLYTYKRYQLYQLSASVPIGSADSTDGLSLDLGAGYLSRAQDQFFGIGNDSRMEDETQYRAVTREASAGFTKDFKEDWSSSVRGVYRRIGVTKPTAGPSLQDDLDSASVPGLFGATMGSIVFSIGRDNLAKEDYAFKGGSDQLQISFNDSLSGAGFQYWRYRFASQHFFPLSNDGRKVIAVRGFVETNQTTAGRAIPFFDMPVLGTSQTLRGFQTFRFRDKTALAASLEYRYRIWPRIDLGLFVDQGQVAPQLGDLALNRFHTGYGLRLFGWLKPTSPISIDYGRSSETWRFYVSFNPRF